MGEQTKLPVGIENFEEIRSNGYYYIDKTKLIEQLLDNRGKVNLFTRPRRFGKTLNMSMLKCFFEIGTDPALFDGLAISSNEQLCKEYMGKYPVIFISLKNVEGLDYEAAKYQMIELIAKEAERFEFLEDSFRLTNSEKDKYTSMITLLEGTYQMSDELLLSSLQTLSELLYKHYGKKTIILIDEYDVPLDKAFQHGYYQEMVTLIRAMFGKALKTNNALEFAVLTGCLRVSKESIFTGLNNFKILSITDTRFDEQFGFNDEEVKELLAYYHVENRFDETKEWYDGYRFGNADVYCPWDVVNHVDRIKSDPNARPEAYWINTSGNDLVKRFIDKATKTTRSEIESLIAGGAIDVPVHEELTYEDMDQNGDALWNFLFFTGYLKAVAQRLEGNTIYLTLAIPNEEVRYIYQNTIREWFEQRQKGYDFKTLYEAMKSGKCAQIEDFINNQLMGSISYYDDAEKFYHGYMLGILSGMTGYEIRSNREQGNGRPDIVLKPFSPNQPAIIVELKHAHKFTQMEELCDKALEQIEERSYEAELVDEGYRIILKYGICFCRKNCMVKVAPAFNR